MIKNKSLFLFLLRIVIGWHLLYEGLVKLLSPEWSALGYLEGSYGFLAGFFHSLAANPSVLKVVNFLNIWGLILIGTGLFLGILVRISAISGLILLMMYYFAYPPFGMFSFNFILEGHYWIINRNFIESIALGLIFYYPALDFSLLNLLKHFRRKASFESEIPEEGLKRRVLLKGLVTLPFYGGVMCAAAKAQSFDGTDTTTGATTVLKKYNLKDLKGTLPKGKLGKLEVSRLIMGCNLIGGWAHARDLQYASSLFRNYNTERKIFDTWDLSEKAGINTVNLTLEMYPFFNKYRKLYGSKIQSIGQIHVDEKGPDKFVNFKRAIDQGATTVYIQGNNGDSLVNDEKFELIQETLEFIRSQGIPAGIGGHDVLTCIGCDNAGIRPDYYMKTMHHERYWSASPVEYRKNFGVIAPNENPLDHNSLHDNMWDLYPENTIDFFSRIEIPLIGFKVMAAGAIKPKDGFTYAFENGADFICAGMFDFQVIEDVNLVTQILNGKLKRKRPWFS